MSAQNQSADETGQRRGVRKINEAVDAAQEQLAEYERTRSQTNLSEPEFRQTELHTDAVRRLHRVTKYCFEKLRYFIETHLEDEYWANQDLDFSQIDWPAGVEYTSGLRALDALPEPVAYRTRMTNARHGPGQQVQEKQVRVTFSAYQRIIRLLDECRGELGFGPNAATSVTTTEIDKELMDQYDEWAAEIRDQVDYSELGVPQDD